MKPRLASPAGWGWAAAVMNAAEGGGRGNLET